MKKLITVVAVLVAIPAAISGAMGYLARRRQAYGNEESETFDIVTAFSGRELKSSAQAFAGGSLLVVCGGVEIDLRRARLDPVGAYLEVDCWFGGVDIRVPEGWRVVLNARAIMGGADNDASDNAGSLPGDAPTLEVDARIVFGGLQISVGPELEEPTAAELATEAL